MIDIVTLGADTILLTFALAARPCVLGIFGHIQVLRLEGLDVILLALLSVQSDAVFTLGLVVGKDGAVTTVEFLLAIGTATAGSINASDDDAKFNIMLVPR